ncbi:MAG: hypothetical protein II038_12290 [Lachnospiraceae bacterium]|nr:hypothetical protein [Lachnospiraceae bacterium]
METTRKQASLKVLLSGLVMLAMIFVGFAATLVGVINLRRGMEEEVATGVLAAC